MFSRSCPGAPDDRPRARLKNSTPHQAPTLALTTQAPVPTTANRHWTKTEATRRALTFKTAAKREDCVVLHINTERRRPTRAAKLEPSSALLRFNAVTPGRTVGLQDCSGETRSHSGEQQPRRSCAFCHRTRTRSGEPAALSPVV